MASSRLSSKSSGGGVDGPLPLLVISLFRLAIALEMVLASETKNIQLLIDITALLQHQTG